jgi:hypothetical protein
MYAQASAKIELPSYLPQQNPAAIFDGATVQPVSFFSAGAEIYAQGEKAGALYQVEFGAVRIYACSPTAAGRSARSIWREKPSGSRPTPLTTSSPKRSTQPVSGSSALHQARICPASCCLSRSRA